MLIAHLSDAHIGPLPPVQFRDLLGKRLTGFINWKRGRSHTHDMALLSHLLEDIHGHRPDHIAMTGDIVNLGLAAEFAPARAFLERLGPPEQVSFVPGNHDAYVNASLVPMQQALKPWMIGDSAAENLFPYVRQREGVALIGLSSGVPTLPFLASGTLGSRQLCVLADTLADLKQAGLCRVIMIHHPPHIGGAKFGRGLTDATSFEQVIARAGAEIILHGHNHRSSLAHLSGFDGSTVPVLGAPSASAMSGTHTHRAGYHLLEITPDGIHSAISLTTRGYDPQAGKITILDQRRIR